MGIFQLGSIVPSTKPRSHDEKSRKKRLDAVVFGKPILRILYDLLKAMVGCLALEGLFRRCVAPKFSSCRNSPYCCSVQHYSLKGLPPSSSSTGNEMELRLKFAPRSDLGD